MPKPSQDRWRMRLATEAQVADRRAAALAAIAAIAEAVIPAEAETTAVWTRTDGAASKEPCSHEL